MGRYDALIDHRTTVVILVEDYLGGVKSWSTRIRKVYEGHPEFNVLMLECPVYSKAISGAYQMSAPTLEDIYEVLAEIKPAIVVPNYTWEAFGICARLIDEGIPLRTIGFCRTDEEIYYGPLEWFEAIIAQFVCVSPECAQTLGDRIPARRNDIHVLPTGIIVPPTLDRKYQTQPVRLVYGGRLSQVQKRVMDFVALAKSLLDRKIDFQLDLVGDGSQAQSLRDAMAELPHGGRVRIHDPLPPEAMLGVWAAHEIFVQTSAYEGTSNSLLESMAVGTVPIVTDASSGIRGVVDEGRNGYIVPIGDMDAMAQRIAEIAQSPERLESLGRAAYESSKQYSVENYERSFSGILRRTLAGPLRRWEREAIFSPMVYSLIRKVARRDASSRPYGTKFALLARRTGPSVPVAVEGPVGTGGDPIVLAVAADDKFALPLATTVKSALAGLGETRRLRVFVIDGGISPENWERLNRSWADPRITVHQIDANLDALQGLKISGHVNILTYARLLLPDLLPAECEKVIYLDSDLIVLQDLGKLWDTRLDDYYILAAQDMTAPFIDSEIALPNFESCGPYLSAVRPLTRYKALGISPEAPYFNCGVLVMNLARWRADGTGATIIDYLNDNKETLRFWDQDGINAVLHSKWALLDPRWNQIPHIYRYPGVEDSPFTRATYEQIVNDPWIVHFATRSKPWHHDSMHPSRDRFFEVVDQTDWKDWRPQAPENKLSNPSLNLAAENTVAQWSASLGGKFESAGGPAPDIPGLRMKLDTPGKHIVLTQNVVSDSTLAGRNIEVSVHAKCDEPNMLGLNVSLWTGAERENFSRSHPGDRVWRKISHEIPVAPSVDRIQVTVVLRAGATKPAYIAAPLLG